MKRLLIVTILSLSLILSGCTEENIDDNTKQDNEYVDEIPECTTNQELVDNECVDIVQYTYNVTTIVPDDFVYSIVNSQPTSITMERYFQVEFTGLEYTPFTNEVCVSFRLEDDEYVNSTYFMILQSEGSILTLQQLSFSISSSSTSHGGCFDAMSQEITYKILIGKVDGDDLNPTNYIDAVALISFKDLNFDERARLGARTLTYDDQVEYTVDKLPFINYEIALEDEDKAIEKVKVILYEHDFNRIIETRVITITIAERNGNGVLLTDLLFENLAPNIDYRLDIYVSGNDGFDDFTNEHIGRDIFTSGCFNWRCGTSYIGLFAGITSVELTETDAVINYIAVNNNEIVSSGDNQPYDMILTVEDKQHIIKYSITLDPNLTSISIPIEYVEYWDIIEISADRDNLGFAAFEIVEGPPEINFSGINNGLLSFTITSRLEDINFISFDFATRIEGTMITNTGIDVLSESNSVEINNFFRIQGLTEIYVFYNISYETLDGTKYEQEWVLVDISTS